MRYQFKKYINICICVKRRIWYWKSVYCPIIVDKSVLFAKNSVKLLWLVKLDSHRKTSCFEYKLLPVYVWFKWGSLCTAPHCGPLTFMSNVCCYPSDMLGKILSKKEKKCRFSMCHNTIRNTMYYKINGICQLKLSFFFFRKLFRNVETQEKTNIFTPSLFINQYRIHIYVQTINDLKNAKTDRKLKKFQLKKKWKVCGWMRACGHGNQPLSSLSSSFPRFSLFLRLLSSSSNVLTTGCMPPLPSWSAPMCLFPKRPMGLTPRPTYQKGSISGPAPKKRRHGAKQVTFLEKRVCFNINMTTEFKVIK